MNIDIRKNNKGYKAVWSQVLQKGNLSDVSVGSKVTKAKTSNNLVLTLTEIGTSYVDNNKTTIQIPKCKAIVLRLTLKNTSTGSGFFVGTDLKIKIGNQTIATIHAISGQSQNIIGIGEVFNVTGTGNLVLDTRCRDDIGSVSPANAEITINEIICLK